MKCGRVVKTCGFVKMLVGAVLIGTGLWIAMSPQVIDCLESSQTCVQSITDLYVVMYKKKGLTQTQAESSTSNVQQEINAFCTCTMDCINFVDVDSTNCVKQLPARPQNNQPGRLLEELREAQSRRSFEIAMHAGRRLSVVTTGYQTNQCLTCTALEDSHETVFYTIGFFLCMVPGVALIFTACCERGSVRMHSRGFMFCALLTDIVASVLFLSGLIYAIIAALATQATCDPTKFETEVKAFAADAFSSDGSDNTALVTQAVMSLLIPVTDKTCELAPRFWLAALALVIGILCAAMAFLGTLCICCSCSEDGGASDSDEEHRLVKQRFNDNDSD